MELFALPLGECCCPYEVIAPGLSDGVRTHIPVAGYLIRLGDGSLVLIDTGMNRLHIDNPGLTWRGTDSAATLSVAMRPEDSLVHRLKQLGITPGDIGYVINTHLHFDHAGKDAILQPPKPEIQPSPRILERATGRDLDLEAAE